MYKFFLPCLLFGLSGNTLGGTGTETISPTTGLFQILFGLIAVLGCMALATWLVKKTRH